MMLFWLIFCYHCLLHVFGMSIGQTWDWHKMWNGHLTLFLTKYVFRTQNVRSSLSDMFSGFDGGVNRQFCKTWDAVEFVHFVTHNREQLINSNRDSRKWMKFSSQRMICFYVYLGNNILLIHQNRPCLSSNRIFLYSGSARLKLNKLIVSSWLTFNPKSSTHSHWGFESVGDDPSLFYPPVANRKGTTCLPPQHFAAAAGGLSFGLRCLFKLLRIVQFCLL